MSNYHRRPPDGDPFVLLAIIICCAMAVLAAFVAIANERAAELYEPPAVEAER